MTTENTKQEQSSSSSFKDKAKEMANKAATGLTGIIINHPKTAAAVLFTVGAAAGYMVRGSNVTVKVTGAPAYAE